MAARLLRVTVTYDVEVDAPDADTAYDALDVGHLPFGIFPAYADRASVVPDSRCLLAFDVEDIT